MDASRLAGQKTYWHLLAQKRMPTEYEVVTSKLHYYVTRGFEISTPVGEWYRKYQVNSPLASCNWELFVDPRETTYSSYTRVQRDKEAFVRGLFATVEDTDYDRSLPEAWLEIFERSVAPMRYPAHGLQMIAAYVAQMAPGARITVAALFQAADEMRRVHWLAYRLRQIQQFRPGFGSGSKGAWETDPLWQPLRRTIEKLLVTYDWGESFVGLNLVVKPVVDELLMTHLGRLARRHGDDVTERAFQSLNDDCAWHRDWSRALVQMVLNDSPRTQEVLREWIARWTPLAWSAVESFRSVFEEMADTRARVPFDDELREVKASFGDFLRSAGLESL